MAAVKGVKMLQIQVIVLLIYYVVHIGSTISSDELKLNSNDKIPKKFNLRTTTCDPRIHALFHTGFLFSRTVYRDGNYGSELTQTAKKCAGGRKKDCSLTDTLVQNLKTSFEDTFSEHRKDVWGNNPPNEGKIALCRLRHNDEAGCLYARLYHLTNLFYDDANLIWSYFNNDGDAQRRIDVFQVLTDLTEVYMHHPDVAVFCKQPYPPDWLAVNIYSTLFVDTAVVPRTPQYSLVEIVTQYVNANADSVAYIRFFPGWRTFRFDTFKEIDTKLQMTLRPGVGKVKYVVKKEFEDSFYYRAAKTFDHYFEKLKMREEMSQTCLREVSNHFCFIYQQTLNTKLYLDNIELSKGDMTCAALLKLNYWLKSWSEIWKDLIKIVPDSDHSAGDSKTQWSIHKSLLQSLGDKINEKDKEALENSLKCLNTEIQLNQDCKSGIADKGDKLNVVCKAQSMLIKATKYIHNYGRTRITIGDKDLKTFIHYLTLDSLEHTIKASAQQVEEKVLGGIKTMGQNLQKYFARIAGFHERKAKYDNKYTMELLTGRQKVWSKEINALGTKIDSLTAFAIGMHATSMVHEVINVFIFAVTLDFAGMNDQAYQIAHTAMDLKVAQDVKVKLVELVAANVDVLSGFQENMKYIKRMDEAFKLTSDDSVQVSNELENRFLLSYGGYTPQIKEPQLVLLGTKLEAYRALICDMLQSGKSETASMRLAFVNELGHTACEDIAGEIAEYGQKLKDVYDFQFAIMESYASYMHASVSKTAANEIFGEQIDETPGNVYAGIKYMSIMLQLEKWIALQEFCNLRKYVEQGIAQVGCDDVPNLIARELLSENSQTCEVRRKYVDIPMKKKVGVDSDLGYVTFEKLFNEQTFSFQIPDKQWLVDNGWITEEDGSTDPVIYLMNLKLVVPYAYSPEKTTVTVKGSLMGGNKLHPTDSESYIIEPSFHISYQYQEGEDAGNGCGSKPSNNPYQICNKKGKQKWEQGWELKPICFNTVEEHKPIDVNNLYPSIYSRWRFKVIGYGTLKQIALPKNPEEMKLKALVTYCIPTTVNKRKKRSFAPSPPNKCCGSNKSQKYYSVKAGACTRCPDSSSRYLKGYYCGDLKNNQ